MIQHAQIQKVLKKVQFQSVRLLESVKSVCIISENEFDMIGSFLQKVKSSQIREIISVLEKWKLLSSSCIYYPNDYSSKEEGKNDITIAPFASSSSLLDFGRQYKDSSISRAAPKAEHEERLIKIWLIAQMRYSLESAVLSKLGSDWSVCRKCIIHMHLRVIHYVYGIVNLSWPYAQRYTWFFIMIVIDSM